MIRRWAAWLVVLVILAAMAALRLADHKERVHRSHDNVTVHARADSAARPGESGTGVGR